MALENREVENKEACVSRNNISRKQKISFGRYIFMRM